jgi:hypothetical protein
MRRGAAWAAASCVAALLVVGCASDTEPGVPEPELRGRVRQSNLDQSLATIRVQVLNDGPEPVDVGDLVLHVPPFPDAASETDAVIPPGHRIDFRVVYGEPTTCSSSTPTPAAATAEALADGRPVEITVDDSQNVLSRLLTLFCDRQRLAELVKVSLGESWTPDPSGDALLGTIEFRRVGGDAAVTVQTIRGSVIFLLQPTRPVEPIAVLRAEQDAISVPIRATALRCDPHALAEGKKNYVFAVWLGMAGGPQEVKVELRVEVGIRPTFDSLCAVSSATGVEP